MKLALIIGTIIIVSLAFITALNINQTWRYRLLENKLTKAELEQNLIYENNKRLLADITELESPERLLRLIEAHNEWKLKQLQPNEIMIIKREGN